jgi:hypothetical protein
VCWKKETHGTGLSAVSLKEAFFNKKLFVY